MNSAPGGVRTQKTTTKDKAKKKLGERITKERQIKRIKRSKLMKAAKQAVESSKPKSTPVLQRSDENGSDGVAPRRDSGFTNRMDVDEFLESGFMQAMDDMEDGSGSGSEAEEEAAGKAPTKASAKASAKASVKAPAKASAKASALSIAARRR